MRLIYLLLAASLWCLPASAANLSQTETIAWLEEAGYTVKVEGGKILARRRPEADWTIIVSVEADDDD